MFTRSGRALGDEAAGGDKAQAPWQLQRPIGRGSFGEVYLATNAAGEQAAVKVLSFQAIPLLSPALPPGVSDWVFFLKASDWFWGWRPPHGMQKHWRRGAGYNFWAH